MENFNLKKFLVENKLTANSRIINEEGHSLSRDVHNVLGRSASQDELDQLANDEELNKLYQDLAPFYGRYEKAYGKAFSPERNELLRKQLLNKISKHIKAKLSK